jgi:hypothetical protein
VTCLPDSDSVAYYCQFRRVGDTIGLNEVQGWGIGLFDGGGESSLSISILGGWGAVAACRGPEL